MVGSRKLAGREKSKCRKLAGREKKSKCRKLAGRKKASEES